MVALAAGKTYLTAGGYVVEIINDELHSSERTAPGITRVGRSVLEINKDPTNTYKDGWYYEPNGTVKALTNEWTEKLRIVEELPFPIPKLPEGYEWADGYPQFREIKDGEYYISNSYHQNPLNKLFFFFEKRICSPATESKFEKKRFAVVRATAMPTPEPTKTLDPLVEKYGEPEAGWRWLADEEKIEKGDEYINPYDNKFVESGNWTTFCKSQTCVFKPYRRKIEIATAEEAQVGDWVECINNSDYEHKLTVGKKYLVQKPTQKTADERFYQLVVDGDKWIGGWGTYRFKKASPPTPVVQEEEKKIAAAKLNFPIYYRHTTGFIGGTKYVKRISENYFILIQNNGVIRDHQYAWDPAHDAIVSEGKTWVEVPAAEVNLFIASKSKEPTDEKVTMKFPIYYNHKHGFNGHTKYVKRINENQYTVILEKDGKEAENEEYLWDKYRDRSVAEGTWIEVPEKEVLDFIASVTVTGANSTLVKKEEEIEMKKETAIAAGKTVAKFAGTWGFKAANYWLFEPAVNIVRPIMKGVRYITLVGALCAAGYGYNHPEMVKNAIKSCIPKITIEAPEVLKG